MNSNNSAIDKLFNGVDESALQIVPFSLFNPYTETLKLDSRLFQFGDRSIKVQQHWQPGGRGGTDIGFGASVYDCSIVLSYFLSDVIANEINGHSVIELGCGPGLASLVCRYVLRPRLVVATDGDTGSIELTNYNILLNGDHSVSSGGLKMETSGQEDVVQKPVESVPAQLVQPVPPLSATNNILPMQLYWGNDEHIAAALDVLDHPALQVECPVLNGTTSRASSAAGSRKGYDVVIMSDIVALVYTDAFDSLLTTMKQLCKTTTVLYLVYKRRHSSEAQFFEKLADSKAFDIKKMPRSSIHGDFRHLPIIIYKLTPLFLCSGVGAYYHKLYTLAGIGNSPESTRH